MTKVEYFAQYWGSSTNNVHVNVGRGAKKPLDKLAMGEGLSVIVETMQRVGFDLEYFMWTSSGADWLVMTSHYTRFYDWTIYLNHDLFHFYCCQKPDCNNICCEHVETGLDWVLAARLGL